MEFSAASSPHILVLPFQAEGHIKPMFNLAKLLSLAGFKITFVNSHHNQARFQTHTDLSAFYSQYPKFQFSSITDGLPSDHPRSGPRLNELFSPISRSMVSMEFRELFTRIFHKKTGRYQPPTCIIADGIMSSITSDVAEEFHVPVIAFRTYSATCTWVTFHMSKLIQEGVIPLQQEDMDKLVSIQGLESFLRCRDLPNYCRLKPEDTALEFFIKETATMARAQGLILNTFDNLEAPIIANLATIFPKVYTIGPLHTLCKNHFSSINGGGLRREDRSCITWLDSQEHNSVLYISFGTVVALSRDQLLEFWHGFVNSGKKFLWVVRRDLITGEGGLGDNIPVELEIGTKERGFVVDWAPQEEVLAHPAVGGFMTHSGWNSALESINEGVPMICWPLLTDQTVNSRCVSEMWKMGVDMKDTCDRMTVEKKVKEVMEERREEFLKRAKELSRMALESVRENGSSNRNLKKLIEDIGSMSREIEEFKIIEKVHQEVLVYV